MFCVIYEIAVTTDNEARFIKLWSQMTEAIRDHMGGLGSRLHKKSEGVFIAYAQWPDRDTWKGAAELTFPDRLSALQREFSESRVSVVVRDELEVVRDLLEHPGPLS